MEHISTYLPEVVNNHQITPFSKEQNGSLLPEEQAVIEHKYKGKQFGRMNQDELYTSIHVLLLKLHVITGWNMPPDEMLDILIDQMAKKFTESYQNVNADEMEFAFRNNATVKDWGKNMNLGLIDEVMIPYLNKRYQLSSIEERMKAEAEKGEYDLRTSVNWRAQVEENYQHFIHGSKFFRSEMHPFEYDQLETDGFIEKGAYKVRLKMYQKKFMQEDKKLSNLAKERTVLQLFRLARKHKAFTLYKIEK